MKMYYVLYNPIAGNGQGKAAAEKIKDFISEGIEMVDITEVDYKDLFAKCAPDDKIVLCGGDGTLNRFINETEDVRTGVSILFFAGGSGNDFLRDLDKTPPCEPFDIGKYIVDLPEVEVRGKKYKFLNGVGYGIDGYCCEEADKLHAAGQIDINYTSIAIKGLLGRFKPRNAKVSVDDKEYLFRNVWIAATMNGRYYGGGMKCAPSQDRLNPDRKVSLVIFRGRSKLATLAVFPSIFSGEHVKHVKRVMVFEGHDIRVEFDKPCALQIDGETALNISSYEVKSARV